jgi:hypothetical protein
MLLFTTTNNISNVFIPHFVSPSSLTYVHSRLTQIHSFGKHVVYLFINLPYVIYGSLNDFVGSYGYITQNIKTQYD